MTECFSLQTGFNRGDFIIQKQDDGLFYVQEVALLDMGRFNTLTEAQSHKAFLEERYD